MKIMLVGPYPPPHGGVSVHLSALERRLTAAGVAHRVLDTTRRRNWATFVAALARSAFTRWTIHFHASGHNWKDWSIALVCACVGRMGAGSILTLHSGLAPDFLLSAPKPVRLLVRCVCALDARVICVNAAIRDSLISMGVRADTLEIAEPCLGVDAERDATLDARLANWLRDRQPVLSTTLFFRPEYAFETLVSALGAVREQYPSVGCIVMGSGEDRSEAERLVRESGLDENIFFAGDVPHDTCLMLMSLSDVFVRATLRDGDSISVREALALGVPVVASRTAFRPAGAILFEPGDAGAMAHTIEAALHSRMRGPAETNSCDRDVPDRSAMDRMMKIYEGCFL